MFAQVLLTLGLLVVLAFLMSAPTLRRGVKLFFSVLPALGIVLVWVPDATTTMAKAVGIGRGADLIMYCWIVATMLMLVVTHLRVRAVHQEMTEMARRVAIDRAKAPPSAET